MVSAVCFGVSDFFAGVAARRVNFVTVTLVSQLFALVLIAAAVPFTPSPVPTTAALLWGGLGGVGSVVGSLALYRGLGNGNMAVAAPLSAVGSAVLPAIVGIAGGDRLAPLAIVGVVAALPAIWLVSKPSTRVPGAALASGTVDGLVAGAGLGLLYVGIGKAGDSSGLWPVLSGETVAVIGLAAVFAIRRPKSSKGSPRRRLLLAMAVLAGVLSVAATVLYFYATHTGALTIAAVLSSIYPGFTVLLAAAVLRERPSGVQLAGLGLCAVAVVAIAIA
nr:DMT family transporter [Spelaeicoccus albus]